MAETVCKTCGLPIELCVCSTIGTSGPQNIKIFTEKRKWGKVVTIVSGLDEKSVDMPKLAKKLKSKLATGGTAKEGRIELQGDHSLRAKDILVDSGFEESIIEV